MERLACATVCCVSLLALGTAAVADPACNGIAVVDVVESDDGSLIPVGERCYERGLGLPFYYDAPNPRTRVIPEPAVGSSATGYEISTIEALGAQSINELTEIHPILDDFSRMPRLPDPWP